MGQIPPFLVGLEAVARPLISSRGGGFWRFWGWV